MSMEDIEEVFHERPRIIFITNPNNPDGKYFPPGLLREVIERAQLEGIYVIIDEIQNCFQKNNEYPGYGPWIEQPHVIRLDSASKRYALAEYRIGWVRADPGLLGTALPNGRSHLEGIVGRMSGLVGNAPRAANTLLSWIMEQEIVAGAKFMHTVRCELAAKADYIRKRLEAMKGIKVIMPEACINITAQTSFSGTDMELAERLMLAGTLLMPSVGYGYEHHPATMRITFAERMEKLEHSMDVLERCLRQPPRTEVTGF